jgi:hypothetical protein
MHVPLGTWLAGRWMLEVLQFLGGRHILRRHPISGYCAAISVTGLHSGTRLRERYRA